MAPRRHGAFVEALALIWDDEIEVKAHDLAKAAAGFAGAEGIVEGKKLWRELRHGNAAIEAGKMFAETEHLAASIHPDLSFSEIERCLHGSGEAALDALF